MNFLDEILEVKKEEVKKLRSKYSYSTFTDSEFFGQKELSFIDEVKTNKDGISIIAEIKKASPSKGVLIENFNHMKIAETYFENEVNAISVLTDQNFFKGDKGFLREIAGMKIKPLLRKDFIIDEFQVYEAKSNGADLILLIAEALSEFQIQELTHAAMENNLEVLLELHSASQLGKINFSLNSLIGINNRNLETFDTDLNTTVKLSKRLPENVILVSESGIKNEDDIKRLKDTKTNAILVGEHLMKSESIKDSIKQLKEWCSLES
jgi:indole-3-glycerol phosphate synthase